MKTVGAILKDAREKKKLTLESIEERTKIRKRFLIAIESDNFSSLPSVNYAKGFVKNYAGILGLDTQYVLAFFRRQISETPRSTLLPKGVSEPLNTSLFRLTPSRFLGIVVTSLTIVFLLYFAFQYQRLKEPPPLTIHKPNTPAVITTERIDVYGKTDPEATVTINGVSVLIRTDGTFYDRLTVDYGINKYSVTATSRYGKTTTKEITVTRKKE